VRKKAGQSAGANPIDPKTYGGMKWRLIGPFRGGRALAVTGVPSQLNTYYFGAAAGGVWKTMDGGISWDPLFDKQTTSSIGSIAVSNSDPNVIYVAPVKPAFAATSPSAMASIVRTTAARLGTTLD